MAGGIGSRFWPMSTTEKPKQFIDVLGVGRTLLQLTLDRFEGICDPSNVWVVTNAKYSAIVHEQVQLTAPLSISVVRTLPPQYGTVHCLRQLAHQENRPQGQCRGDTQ